MEITSVKGKEILMSRTPYAVFSAFSDLTHFSQGLPAEYQGMVTADADSLLAEIKGIKIGVKVSQRVPYSLICFTSDGESPFPFTISLHLEPVGLDQTLFHIEFNAELNMMMKMMIGKKLQEVVDTLTDQIEHYC